MTFRGIRCELGEVTKEQCFECMKNPRHPCNIPQPMLVRFWHGVETKPASSSFTPSRLLHCYRQPVLEEQTDYWLDIHNQFASMRGEVVHAGLESMSWGDDVEVMTEVRLTTNVDTMYGLQKFTAQSDAVVQAGVDDAGIHLDIWDWKTTEFGYDFTKADSKHMMQVWMYAWMVKRNFYHLQQSGKFPALSESGAIPVRIRSVNICYISASKPRIFTSLGPNTARGKRITGTKPAEYEVLNLEAIPTLSMERVEKFIRARIEQKIRAREVLPPPLEGEDAKWCYRCPVYGACVSRAKQDAEGDAA